jgi:hypothetical protein
MVFPQKDEAGSVMSVMPARLKAMIEAELVVAADPGLGIEVRKWLVEPYSVRLNWDYGLPGEQFPGWVVFAHGAESETAIAYCDRGFGPSCPWGLTSSKEVNGGRPIGSDSGWFPTFVEAFTDSWAAADARAGI